MTQKNLLCAHMSAMEACRFVGVAIAIAAWLGTGCGAASVTPGSTPTTTSEPSVADQRALAVRLLGHDDASRRLLGARQLRVLGAHAASAVPSLLRAAHDPDPQVRDEVHKLLRGLSPALIRVAQTHRDATVRAEAVVWLAGDDALRMVAERAPTDTGARAIARIEDQTLLLQFALTGSDRLAQSAAGHITDPAVLMSLVRQSEDARRTLVLRQVESPALLLGLIRNADPTLGREVEKRLGALLRATPAADRAALVARLDDRDTLVSLARNGQDTLALALVDAIDDPGILAILAARRNPKIATAALERKPLPDVLDAASTHADETVRLLALRHIDDPVKIASAARRDVSPGVRMRMVARLTSRKTLRQIARSDSDRTVRRLASFLARRRRHGRKPLVALEVRSDRFQSLARRTATRLLDNKALIFKCSSPSECEHFDARLTAIVEVSDTDRCYERFYVYGPCGLSGKQVSFDFHFARDGKYAGLEQFDARTPDAIRYRAMVYNGVNLGSGPSEKDVWRNTKKAVVQAARDWEPSGAVDLDAFLTLH